MSPEVAVARYLATVDGVTDLVGTRIWQLKLPQTPRLPALRVQLIDEPIDYHLRGPSGAERARVQVDAYGSESGSDPYGSVVAVADAVDAALSGQVFTLGSPEEIRVTGVMRVSRQVLYESEELRVLRVMQDYIVWSEQV